MYTDREKQFSWRDTQHQVKAIVITIELNVKRSSAIHIWYWCSWRKCYCFALLLTNVCVYWCWLVKQISLFSSVECFWSAHVLKISHFYVEKFVYSKDRKKKKESKTLKFIQPCWRLLKYPCLYVWKELSFFKHKTIVTHITFNFFRFGIVINHDVFLFHSRPIFTDTA